MHKNATEQATGMGSNTLPNAAEIAPSTPWQRLLHATRRVIDMLLLWQERRGQRRALAMLGDDILKDIGITRLEAERESFKRPWCE
jgi:uncharacterized protein YjiS (DUF1127 family)